MQINQFIHTVEVDKVEINLGDLSLTFKDREGNTAYFCLYSYESGRALAMQLSAALLKALEVTSESSKS